MLQKQNAKDIREKIDPYGPERPHWFHALEIAWKQYYHLSKQEILDKKRVQHYKRVIRKLQDNLGKPLTPFIIY
jgi:hypothetical protein